MLRVLRVSYSQRSVRLFIRYIGLRLYRGYVPLPALSLLFAGIRRHCDRGRSLGGQDLRWPGYPRDNVPGGLGGQRSVTVGDLRTGRVLDSRLSRCRVHAVGVSYVFNGTLHLLRV